MKLPAQSRPFNNPLYALKLLVVTLLMAGAVKAADFTVRTINDEFAYTINGTGGNPPLTLVRGQTYSFDVSTCVCHPFQILNADGSLLAGTVVANNNISSGTVVFAVPLTAINYKYRCSVHLFGSTITTIAPPASTTGQATNLGGTSATLNASINPNGAATTASFIYGTDPALQTGTTTTTGQAIGSGNSAVAVTAPITGLQPVTTYYYQAQATNSASTTQGSILSFTTPSTDASLSGLAVSQGTMNISFDPGTLAYAEVLAFPVASLTVTPTATESHATIKVNGTTVISGAASSSVSLNVGSNVITVLVTAQDGVTTESYTVTVSRAAFNNTDYTFGTNGQAVTNAGPASQARGVVIQPDGKIVAVGAGLVNNSFDFIVARYNADGSLDTTFQSTGKVSTDLGGLDDGAQSAALQADGKIVVAGFTNANSAHYQFALVRYNTDGSLDTTFNTTGRLIPSFGTSSERAAAVAVQKDGRIIVVGAVTVSSKSAMAVARFNSDGSPDTTFNSTGQLIVPAGTDSATGTSVVVQPDGAILVGGSSVPTAGSGRFALWRFLANGTADTTLGGSGEVTTGVGSFGASAAGMALQKDGKIVLAGSAVVNSSGNIAVVRFNGDGSLDTTFNTTGKVTTQVSGAASTASSVLVQADGKIAVAGTAGLGGGNDIALVRFNADGSLDTTFNSTGWVTTDLGGLDHGQGLALQRDGKLVVVGQSGLGNYDFAVLRYNSGLTVAPFAWGNDTLGQLGDGHTLTDRLSPVAVQLTGALAGKTVVSVAPGNVHTVALCSDGTVACWGSNYSGELGNNTTTPSAIPVPVDTSVNSALHNKTVIAIAAGSSHSLALCSDGTVAAWGAGGYGQLGNTQGTDSPIPVAMYAGAGSAIQGKTVVDMAGGQYHTYLLCSDGTVCGCGHNFGGQIGTGSSSPILVTYPTAVTTSGGSALAGKTVVAIATGLYHGLALCSDGSIVGWGRDAEGELGDGTATASVYTPVAMNQTTGLLAGKTVLGMAAGGLHSLVLCTDGTIAAWGSNSSGQFGNGTDGWNPVTVAVPVDTSGVLFGKKVVSVMAGTNFSFALCSDGTVASWGDNGSDELGSGTNIYESKVPVLVDTAPLAAAGARFTSLSSCSNAFHETAMVVLPPAPKLVVVNGAGIAGTQRSNNGVFSFADTSVSSSTPQTFTIENAGSADLTGLVVTKSGGNPGDFALAIGGLPGTLAPGASATFTVTFSPSALGVRTAVVQIASNDASASPFSIQVTGTDPTSDANLSSLVPGAGTFSSAFDSATTSYVDTFLGGTTNLSLTPTVAQAGSTVTINGSPVASGSASTPVHLYGGANTLTVIVTGADGVTTKTYLVSVTIDAPHIVVEHPAGTPLTFGSATVDIGTAAPGISLSTVFTIRNAGTQNLTGLGITIDETNATEFTVTTNPFGLLPAGNTTTFTVSFTPTTTGPRSAILHITSNDPDEPTFDIRLTAPKLVVLNGTGIAGTQRSNNGVFSFADTSVNSSSLQTFTIENAGSADLTGLVVTKTLAGNPGEFALVIAGVPGTLAAGASATFTVIFSPTALGVRTAVVQIASNDASASPYSIPVTGTDPTSDANLSSLVPGAGTFSSAFDSATTSYVATLPGGITNLSLTPTVTQAGSTVTINGSPVASGSNSAPVHLYGGANTLTIIVTGVDGITTKTYLVTATIDAPHIVVEQPAGTPLTFGSASAEIGTAAPGTSASTVFTIRNVGTQNLTGLGITIDGTNGAEFTVTTNPTAPLAAANTTSFTVTFTPTTTGPRSAILHIASNDPDEPSFDISLTGRSHTVAFDHSSQTQVEAAVTITVPVRLSSAFATAFTVPVTFAELPSQNDFTHSVSPVTFAIGKTVANVTLTLINNNVVTGDRTVTLTLGQPSVAGVALGTPSVFTLTILEDDAVPLISSQPQSQIILAGTPVTFTSGATGSPPLTLQWKKNNVAVAGATTSTLTYPAVALTDAGAYTFTATNHHPTVTSSVAQLAVVDGTSTIIRTNAGTAPTMTVKAAGNLLTYRWQLHGSPLSTTNTSKYVGVTTKTLTVKTAAAGDDGDYTCLVTAPGGSQVSGTFTLEVPTSKPVALTPHFPDSVAYNAYSYQLPYDTSASDAPTKFVCAHLPTGLTCNALTGVVSGKPTAVGTFSITVTLSNSVGPGTPVQGNLVVSAYPIGAVGAYVGRIDRDSSVNGDLGGRLDLTTTSTGSFTGTLRLGASAYALNSAMITDSTAGAHPGVTLTIARGLLPAVQLSLDLDPVGFGLIGTAQVVGGLTSASITGWRNTWHTTLPANPVSAQLGSHSFELEPDGGSIGLIGVPQGCGYAMLTVTAVGVTTVSGHTSDGNTFTTGAVLGPNGEVLVCQLLYTNKGSLMGSLAIASNATHSISGALDWQKNAISTARDYKPFAVGAIAYGGLYTATLPVLGLPVQVLDNARLTFDYGGLVGSATNPNTTLHISALNAVVLPQPNPGKITAITLTSSTTGGTFSGKFTLTDGAVLRTVSFQGQLVSPLGKGYGYFLLPQLADPLAVPPITSANSPILSGKVVLGPIRIRST